MVDIQHAYLFATVLFLKNFLLFLSIIISDTHAEKQVVHLPFYVVGHIYFIF